MQSAPRNGAPRAGGGKILPPAIWDRLKAKADEVGGVLSGYLYYQGTCGCLGGIACEAGVIEPPTNRETVLQNHDRVTNNDFARIEHETTRLFGLPGVAGFPALDNAIDRAGYAGVPNYLASSPQLRVPFELVMAQLRISRGVELETPEEAAAADAIGDEEGGATNA